MPQQTPTIPYPDENVTAALPPLPPAEGCDDGYDWMELLGGPWWPLAGFMGRMVGDWPYVCVALYTDRQQDVYGLAVWDRGRVSVSGYAVERDRTAAVLAHVTED